MMVDLILLTADLINSESFSSPPWGIYLGGVPVVVADTVMSVEFKGDYSVSDYLVEKGSFESYNKVAQPFTAKIKFVAGGSIAARQALLDSIASIIGDLKFYDVVTPETVHKNVNLVHHDYTRASNSGLGVMSVDVWCQEIRENVSQSTNSSASPSVADQKSGGAVQASAANPAQTAAVSRAAPSGGIGSQ